MGSDVIFERYKDLKNDGKEQEKKEKEYPEIAMEVGKFVREVGRGIWECSIHHLPVSPLIKVCIYTLDGQFIAAHSFASSCFGDTTPNKVTQAVIKEIGSYCAGTAAVALVALAPNPGFWVVLAVGVGGAIVSLAYSTLVDIAWKFSSQHDFLNAMDPVYATPNIEQSEFMKRHPWPLNKVRTKRKANYSWEYSAEALPEDFFVGHPANSENYVGITSEDFSPNLKWLIKLK